MYVCMCIYINVLIIQDWAFSIIGQAWNYVIRWAYFNFNGLISFDLFYCSVRRKRDY